MRNIAVLVVVLLLFSCQNRNKTPDYVIPSDQMVQIIVDLHITDGMFTINNVRRNLAKEDSINYYDAVFDHYGYNRHDFDTSIYFYSNHIAEYDKIYEGVLNKLGEMETKRKEENTKEAIETNEIKEVEKVIPKEKLETKTELNVKK